VSEAPPAREAAGRGGNTKALATIFLATWGSGFIACKAGLYHAEPLTYLALRFVIAGVLLAIAAWLTRAPWPRSPSQYRHLAIAGVLIHSTYLGPNFVAASHGFPVGVTALIGALQPLLTAAVASQVLGERVTRTQWVGLTIGLVGIAMVLSDKLVFDWSQGFELLLVGVGVVSLTAGTLYQKRHFAFMDLRTGAVVQLMVAAMVAFAGATAFESFRLEWTAQFVAALSALVVISLVSYAIMHVLFLRGAAARVASMFYLVPPFTSTIFYFFFDENLGAPAIAGIVVTVLGVALSTRPAPSPRRSAIL
jgi:drug/metabolite transporter (DMT)-like permease